MTEHADYRSISPEPTKPREEYTYAERRADLYNMLDSRGHYRNLEQSTRQLGDRYGVSHTTIQNDIRAILEYKKQNLGENTEAELETLKTKAVMDALNDGDSAKAYDIISQHLENLQSLGIIDEKADALELQGGEDIGANAGLSPDDKEQLDALLDS